MIIKNISNEVKFVKVDGEWISVEPSKQADLPVVVLRDQSGWEKVKGVKEVKVEKFSKTDLVDKTKEEQIAILRSLGVNKGIEKLSNENKRVNAILKLQN